MIFKRQEGKRQKAKGKRQRAIRGLVYLPFALCLLPLAPCFLLLILLREHLFQQITGAGAGGAFAAGLITLM